MNGFKYLKCGHVISSPICAVCISREARYGTDTPMEQQGIKDMTGGKRRWHDAGTTAHLAFEDVMRKEMHCGQEGSKRWHEAMAHLKQVEENHRADALGYAFGHDPAPKNTPSKKHPATSIFNFLALLTAGVLASFLIYLFLRGNN